MFAILHQYFPGGCQFLHFYADPLSKEEKWSYVFIVVRYYTFDSAEYVR